MLILYLLTINYPIQRLETGNAIPANKYFDVKLDIVRTKFIHCSLDKLWEGLHIYAGLLDMLTRVRLILKVTTKRQTDGSTYEIKVHPELR